MRKIFFLCYVVSMVCSCSHVHHLDAMSDEETKFFEERATKKSFSVQMHDERVFDGTGLVVETDTIAWNDSESGKPIQVAADQVQQIVFVSKSAGFGNGFLIGLIIGASVGGILGYAGGEDCGDHPDFFCISRGGGAFLGAVLIGVPAGIVGGLIGVGKGSRHIYYPATVGPAGYSSKSEPAAATDRSD